LATILQRSRRGIPARLTPVRRAAGEHVASKASRDTSPNYGDRMSAQRRPPDVDDEFLTVAEVAAMLKLNQQTIELDRSGVATCAVHGRRVRVLRRDLDQLIADAETASRVDQPGLVEDGEEEGGAMPSSARGKVSCNSAAAL
jgi:hypothetical protein